MGLVITFLLGLSILAGALLARTATEKRLWEQMSIAVAFGSITALVFWEMLPELFEHMQGFSKVLIPICAMVGLGFLKLLDFFIPEHDGEHTLHHECTPANVAHIGIISALAVTLHNITEGMAVYGVVRESFKVGSLMALGVGLHNIPMGMVLYATLKNASTFSRYVLLALACGSTFLGGFMMFIAWEYIGEALVGCLISCSMGMLLYIVAFELLPHLLHSDRKWLSALGVAVGVGIIAVSVALG